MADTTIKPEIKLDPAAATPTNMADLEEFEDDTDLQIPTAPPDGPQAWLVKVPKEVWRAWSDIYRNYTDDVPIEIGEVSVWEPEPGNNMNTQRTQIRLYPGVPQHQELPKQYDLKINTQGYSNTVVFSEKDLPGHHNRSGGRLGARAAAKRSGMQVKSERYGHHAPLKPGTYRSAIPKQTALAPMIQHVADAQPVVDESYFALWNKKYEREVKPARQTTFQRGVDRAMHPGLASMGRFGTLGSITAKPRRAGGKPAPKEKAVRMDQKDLLDAIYRCFRRYTYWSLKALRNELKQPEAYIKSTLDGIATLVRSGDFAMNYVLKPEYLSMAQVKPDEVKEETALVKSEDEESEAGATGSEMEVEDEEEFEDVKMEDDAGASAG